MMGPRNIERGKNLYEQYKNKILRTTFILLIVISAWLVFGSRDTTDDRSQPGTDRGNAAALERLGEQQQRSKGVADHIGRGLDRSLGTVTELELSNSALEEAITGAENNNNGIAGAINRAENRLTRAFRLIDDSQCRITACKAILSEDGKGTEAREKEE